MIYKISSVRAGMLLLVLLFTWHMPAHFTNLTKHRNRVRRSHDDDDAAFTAWAGRENDKM